MDKIKEFLINHGKGLVVVLAIFIAGAAFAAITHGCAEETALQQVESAK